MTITSSWGWILSATSSVKVIGCSSRDLARDDRPESWMVCTTFRYAFFDLDNWFVELPPMITLISPSGGRDDSSIFPFNFSSLCSCPRKFLNFPCLMRFSICYFKSKHSSISCPMISMKATILVSITLVGISLHFLWPLQRWIILDLHKNLLKWNIQWGILLVPCWRARLLIISVFPFFRLSLFWTRALLKMSIGVCFYSLRSLSLLSYDRVFCIHKILGWMDEFNHGLRLLLIKLVDEQIRINPIVKGHQ